MIFQFIEKNHRRWDEYYLPLQFAYNTARHEATGYIPAYLNYGRKLAGSYPATLGKCDPSCHVLTSRGSIRGGSLTRPARFRSIIIYVGETGGHESGSLCGYAIIHYQIKPGSMQSLLCGLSSRWKCTESYRQLLWICATRKNDGTATFLYFKTCFYNIIFYCN